MTKIGLFVSLLFGQSIWAQSSHKDSISYCLSNLNPSSVIISTTYTPEIVLGICPKILVDSKDKNVEFELCKGLSDKEKILAIHVILTLRHYITTSLSELIRYQKDSVIGIDYSYNKLKWSNNSGEITISANSIKACQKYWKKLICKNNK